MIELIGLVLMMIGVVVGVLILWSLQNHGAAVERVESDLGEMMDRLKGGWCQVGRIEVLLTEVASSLRAMEPRSTTISYEGASKGGTISHRPRWRERAGGNRGLQYLRSDGFVVSRHPYSVAWHVSHYPDDLRPTRGDMVVLRRQYTAPESAMDAVDIGWPLDDDTERTAREDIKHGEVAGFTHGSGGAGGANSGTHSERPHWLPAWWRKMKDGHYARADGVEMVFRNGGWLVFAPPEFHRGYAIGNLTLEMAIFHVDRSVGYAPHPPRRKPTPPSSRREPEGG